MQTRERGREIEGALVRRAVDRAVAALRDAQEPDGRWQSEVDMGPLAVALLALTEWWFGALSDADTRAYVKALRLAQRADGGFDLHPYAREASLGATAVCRAAMRALGVDDTEPCARAADARLAALGGLAAVRERLRSRGEPAAIFCVMVGLLREDALPPISPDLAALPWSERMLDGRLHAGVPMVIYALAAVRRRATEGRPSLLPSFLRQPTRLVARTRLSGYIGQFQNDNGSWNNMVFSTCFALLALEGVGLDARDPMIHRGLAWLETRKTRTKGTVTVAPFDGPIWETAFAVLALEGAGLPADDASLRAAATYLQASQCAGEQPRSNQPKAGAPRTGGWPYMRGNDTMPDTDDTGVVLAALGATRHGGGSAATRGIAWLRGMQNASGGWGSYVHGLPDKTPGMPAFAAPPPRLDDLKSLASLLVNPPAELGDPAVADVCGRVLLGLGGCGLRVDDDTVSRAVAFLERDQCASGAWWGLWNPAYVAGTSFALLGLAAVEVDLRRPFVQRALSWLIGVQNDDGGFGEDYRSFHDPSLAGRAPSMPPLTGIALAALATLAHTGNEARAAAARAAAYLVETQRAEGDWSDEGYLFTIVPPTMYAWGHHRLYYPLLGLGRYASSFTARRRARRTKNARGSPRADHDGRSA